MFLLSLLFTAWAECEFSTMSIGNFNLTSERQLKDIIKKEPVFLLGLTSLSCEKCCEAESFYSNLVATLAQYSPRIPFIRHNVDSSAFISKYFKETDPMPLIYGIRKGKFYRYHDLKNVNRVLKFADRLVAPVSYIPTLEEAAKFIEPPTGGYDYLKVLALVSDSDFRPSVEKAYSPLASWFSAELKAIADKTIIAELRALKPAIPSDNCLLLWTPTEFKVLDLEGAEMIYQWIVENSAGLLEEVSPYNFQMYAQSNKPMIFMFIDPLNEYKNFYLEELKKTARKFEDKVKFVWIDGTNPEYIEKRWELGLVTEILPAVTFNTRNFVKYCYPEGLEISERTIDTFVQGYLDDKKSNYVSKLEKKELNLAFCEILTSEDFDERTSSPDRDSIIFFYSSHNSKDSEKIAPNFNRVCRRLKELEISTVNAYVFDVAAYRVPRNIKSNILPTVYISPAFDKDSKVKEFKGPFDALSIMKFVERHAGNKIKLPELPHLDEKEKVEYFQQKEKAAEEERRAKAEAEERRIKAEEEEQAKIEQDKRAEAEEVEKAEFRETNTDFHEEDL